MNGPPVEEDLAGVAFAVVGIEFSHMGEYTSGVCGAYPEHGDETAMIGPPVLVLVPCIVARGPSMVMKPS